MMKRFYSLILVLCLILSSTILVNVSAQKGDASKTKTVYTNVAHGKTVYAPATKMGNLLTNGVYKEYLVPDHCTYGNNTVTLPTGDVVEGATGYNNDWYIVDLGRRYKIEEIKLYARGDGGWNPTWMKHFDILASNSVTFPEYDTARLGGIGSDPESAGITSALTPFKIKVEGERVYRYIKLKKTDWSYHGYSEIEVYASQTVTYITSGCNVFTNSGSVISGENAVNGTNIHDGDAWIHDGTTAYNYLSIDLLSAVPVGMIELEGRNLTAENPATRENFAIYGSNEISNMESLSLSDVLSIEDGYKLLYKHGYANAYYSEVYPKYPGVFCMTFDDSEAFRYITIRNTTKHASAIGEVRLYVVNPEVYGVTWDADKLYICFSDEMSDETETTGLVKLTSETNGDEKIPTVAKEDDYTYSVDISELDVMDSYTLTVSDEIVNNKGIGLAGDYTLFIPSLYPLYSDNLTIHGGVDAQGEEIKNLAGQESISVKAHVTNNSFDEKSVKCVLALYDAQGRLESLNTEDYTIDSGEAKDVIAAITFEEALSEGMYVCGFVWEYAEDKIRPLTGSEKTVYDPYNIYVSAKASENGMGTFESPFATIEEAQNAVRNMNDSMTQDITVHIMGGVYELDDTLVFTDEDSGANGYKVKYTAYNDEEVVISGGTRIPENDWKLVNESENIYSVQLNGVADVRDLYVDGRRARVARSKERIRPLGMYYAEDGETALGYYVSSEDVGLFENPSDIRLSYTQVWKYTVCNVEDIIPDETEGRNIIIMQSDAFDKIVNKSDYLFLSEENAFYMENAMELLDEAGEFYYDKTDGNSTLYYKLSEGETLKNVFVPRLEKILTVTGQALDSKARNLEFSNLTFAHALRNDLTNGYLGGQAQSMTPLKVVTTAYPLDNTIVGANIRVTRAEDISFNGNTFVGLASVGLGIYEGSNDIEIRGNVFYDIGDSAITVGLPSDAYMDEAYYDAEGNYIGRNVALNKNVSTSGGSGYGYSGNDGDAKTVWTTNYKTGYWQVDLGEEYTINQIRIKSRKNYGSNPDAYKDYDLYRRNFKIMASNDENFSDGGVIMAEQGATAFDYSQGFVKDVSVDKKYRFIRIQKTVNEHFPLADVEVISADVACPIKEVSKGTVIDNNYITRVGEFNLGAPGIQLYYTENAEIKNNYIKDVPYSGICVGWGWLNTLDSTTAKNNKVLNNLVENYAMRTYDAGGVYLLGTQQGNVVDGNYLKNQPNAYYALYLDSGAENATLTNNVTEDVAMVYAIGTVNTPSDKKNLVITDNYSTTASYVNNPGTDTNCVVENPVVYLPSGAPSEAAQIINAAGLTDNYKSLVQKVPCGRWTLTIDDIYGDVIDHQKLISGSGTGESMPDTTMISYYLSNLLKDARKLYALGEDSATDEALSAMKSAINVATAKETQFKNQGYGYNGVTKAPIDRKALIDVRVALMNAMKVFNESLIK